MSTAARFRDAETFDEPLPLGELALQAGIISRAQLEAALSEQQREGGRIGRHLILSGSVSRMDLYRCLADQCGLPFVNLLTEPPDSALLLDLDPRRCIEFNWIPYRREGDTLVIATAEPPSHRDAQQAMDLFQVEAIDFVITTDWDVTQAIARACRARLSYSIADELAVTRPSISAAGGIRRWQWFLCALFVVFFFGAYVILPMNALILTMVTANAIFMSAIIFKTLAAIRWPFRSARMEHWDVQVADERIRRNLPPFFWHESLSDDEMPIYTVLVPAFHEQDIIGKILSNLEQLDYPKSKLEVFVLLEESDEETLAAARAASPPEYVRILVVPAGTPQTKPRACNYGLEFARGEFIVIFDAEDRPEPDQLRMAMRMFRRSEFERKYVDPSQQPLICIQAALSYFNADYNVLTRMFATEYSMWFDAMLPGLDGSGIPLPLGGTSNHFHTQALREIGGWDPYNVTEDADLGLRAAADGYRVKTMRSTTWEEACSQVRPWIRQRTRWIKGYLVTSAVNARHPIELARKTGARGVIGMLGLIFGTPLAFLSYPISLLFTLVTYVGVRVIGFDLPEWVLLFGSLTMIFGNLMIIAVSAVTAWARYGWRIAAFSIFAPIYWILHAFAAWRAVFQLVTNNQKWEKTPHGLTGDYTTENLVA